MCERVEPFAKPPSHTLTEHATEVTLLVWKPPVSRICSYVGGITTLATPATSLSIVRLKRIKLNKPAKDGRLKWRVNLRSKLPSQRRRSLWLFE
jgi:hypothetical protein